MKEESKPAASQKEDDGDEELEGHKEEEEPNKYTENRKNWLNSL